MTTIGWYNKAQKVIRVITKKNNDMVASAISLNAFLTNITNLSTGDMTSLQNALNALGVTTTDFNNLRTSLAAVVTSISTNLSKIEDGI